MADVLEINGKTLHTIKAAAQKFSYSRDYITRLAREQKIEATTVGRQWFVDFDSLREYAEATAREQEERNHRLSEERRQEQAVRQTLQQQQTKQHQQVRRLPVRAAAITLLVLVFGLAGGVFVQQVIPVGLPTVHLVGSSAGPTQSAAVTAPAEQPAAVSKSDAVKPLETEVVEATKDVRPMGEDVMQGVLLLPDPAASTTEVAELFSDPVLLSGQSTGTMMITPLDETGEPIGPAVPYVLVPVKQDKPEKM